MRVIGNHGRNSQKYRPKIRATTTLTEPDIVCVLVSDDSMLFFNFVNKKWIYELDWTINIMISSAGIRSFYCCSVTRIEIDLIRFRVVKFWESSSTIESRDRMNRLLL